MIHVIATIEVVDGARDEFLTHFRQLVPKVLVEDGCVEYGPKIDVETGIEIQEPLRRNIVVVLEKWETIDDLKKHLDAPHMNEYRETVKDLVQGMTLEVLEPA